MDPRPMAEPALVAAERAAPEPEPILLRIVYYGPSLGGKTANLQALATVGARGGGAERLLSLQASDDRTLLFDLLPVDLGPVCGVPVGLRLLAVAGQVRCDLARQIVLAGADALVFVCDSNIGREEQNRWSRQNLMINLRAARMESCGIPVVYQFNKQDLPESAPPSEVARWLRIEPGAAVPAIATENRGVVETLALATRRALERHPGMAGEPGRGGADVRHLGAEVERAFAPWRVDGGDGGRAPAASPMVIALNGEDLARDALLAALELAERVFRRREASERPRRSPEPTRREADRRAASLAGELEALVASLDQSARKLRDGKPGARARAARVAAIAQRSDALRCGLARLKALLDERAATEPARAGREA